MEYKRILTIQDISCVGQCSMTVALPILSACGHETCILPTAVLSTHTGGFINPVFCNLADDTDAMWHHWEREKIRFDAIYSGYLGSVDAIRQTEQIMDQMLAPGGIKIVDPAMGDGGKLYSGLDMEYAMAMKALCRKADIILPNITEAAALSGIPYRETFDENDIRQILTGMDHKCVVLTGVGYEPLKTGVLVWENGAQYLYSHPKLQKSFHGTGDIFASCFTGCLMQGKNIREAAAIGADMTYLSICNTISSPAHWYGVKFETMLPELIHRLQK